MKKLIQLLITLILLSSSLFAEIDERKVDLYYANGMFGEAKNSEKKAWQDYVKVLKKSNPNINKMTTPKIAYNSHTLWGADDVIEVMFQKIIGDTISWAKTQDYLQSYIVENEIIEAVNILSQAFNAQDLVTHLSSYKESINAGHGVVVVAHSQGNFFTNKAYEYLEDWQKKYFHMIGVASPSSVVAGDGLRVSFDNDLVPFISLAPWTIENENKNRGIDPLTMTYIDYPTIKYHSFSYYMGGTVTVTDLGIVKNVSTDKAKDEITNGVINAINLQKSAPSQYNTNATCTNVVTGKHIAPSSGLADIEKVFVVSENGKVFHDGEGYVKAFEGDYIDRNDATSDDVVTPNSGVIEVLLTWKDVSIDLNLEVEIGEKDISDVCRPLEHYYVATEADVSPGTYQVRVTHSGDVENSLIPQDVTVNIHANGAAMMFDFNITSTDMLNLGHVADIIIKEDNSAELVYVPSTHVNAPVVTSYANINTAEYYSYIYEVQSRLRQALLGPLSNAKVELSNALNFQDATPFYESATTGGTSLLTSGVFYFSNTLLNTIEYGNFYVLSIIGGNDLDSNDDGVLDSTLTQNNGSLHAVLSGQKLKTENFKVNIITEVIYQVSQEIISDANLTSLQVTEHLDEIAKRLIIEDVNDDGVIDYDDALEWLPMFDKDKLRKPYDENYQSVVQKIYDNADIYDGAYALVYEPIFNPQTLSVFEDAGAGDFIGKVNIDLYDEDVSYSLVGQNNDFFEIAQDGTVSVSYTANLDYETVKYFSFTLSADIGSKTLYTTLSIRVKNVEDAPIIENFVAYIDEFSLAGTVVGQLDINSSLGVVNEIVLSDRLIRVWNESSNTAEYVFANDSESFSVDLNGTIRVSDTAILNYQTKKEYLFYVTAKNSYGVSEKATISININNLINSIQEPISVYEHIKIDTLIATFDVEQYTSLNISEIVVLGAGSDDFSFTTDGNVYVAKDLDYERQKSYSLTVQVVGDNWQSNEVDVSIDINSEDTINIISKYSVKATDIILSEDKSKIYVARGIDGMASILDITDIQSPTAISEVNIGGITNGIALYTNESLMVVNDSFIGFRVVDISDVFNPIVISGLYTLFSSSFMTPFKHELKAYTVAHDINLNLIDYSNPSQLTTVSTQILDSKINAISLNDSATLAYVATEFGVDMYDSSDRSNIKLILSLKDIGNVSSIKLSSDEKTGYIFSDSGMYIVDTTNLEIITNYKTSNHNVKNVAISNDGTKLYLVDYLNGLYVLDIRDTQNIKVILNYYIPTMYDVELLEELSKVIISSEDNGIIIIDIGSAI